jgi:hypothetical protein
VLTYILGAPGSGKTALVEPLTKLLPGHVIADWDLFMDPACRLAGADIRTTRETWPAYTALVRCVVDGLASFPRVVLGVCTRTELADWPIDRWLLLDCSDDERRRRLGSRLNDDDIADASSYRTLGLEAVDSTTLNPTQVAQRVADLLRGQ